MANKRFTTSPQLKVLAGTEAIPATSVDGGTDTSDAVVAPDTDVKITVLQLLGLKVKTVPVAGGVATINCGNGIDRNHVLPLTGNVTLALSALAPPGYATEGEVRIAQNAAGNWGVAFPASWKPLGGSDTSVRQAPDAVTVLSFKTMNDGSTVEYAMQESA